MVRNGIASRVKAGPAFLLVRIHLEAVQTELVRRKALAKAVKAS
jgi:hypothetical protein